MSKNIINSTTNNVEGENLIKTQAAEVVKPDETPKVDDFGLDALQNKEQNQSGSYWYDWYDFFTNGGFLKWLLDLFFKDNDFFDLSSFENYNILFTNNINFITLILVIIIATGFVLFLLLQAKLLNISFYPNSTFDSEKYSPYECGFAPF